MPKFVKCGLWLFFMFGMCSAVCAQEWREIKDDHFVVYYDPAVGRDAAQTLLRRAEDYYRKIGDQIGYNRYTNFWTWDERVKIFVFADQKSFVESTGQPAWATGYADRDSQLFKSRVIITYRQEQDFFDGLLPHEISHLILHDFIVSQPIPIWFDEGVAQLNEGNKRATADQMMRVLVAKNKYIALPVLSRWDIRREREPHKVTVFYAESLSLVDFLIKKFGLNAFSQLCRYMRDGKPFEEALRRAYSNYIVSLEDLERQWLEYMNRR